jgi:hypothetical protein
MSSALPVLPPLFLIEADALLSGKDNAREWTGEITGELSQKHRRWLAGVDDAPPWRVPRTGFGFEMAPADVPPNSEKGAMAAHFLPSGNLAGQALSLTVDQHTRVYADLTPILRALAEFALDLSAELDSAWVAWTPAHMAYPRAFLAEQLAGWADGGRIPLLAFVNFGMDAGGATVTQGLAFFRLPELRFTADTPMAKGEQVRRMVRMAYALLADTEPGNPPKTPDGWDGEYVGLAPGERMRVRRRGPLLNLTSFMPKSAQE